MKEREEYSRDDKAMTKKGEGNVKLNGSKLQGIIFKPTVVKFTLDYLGCPVLIAPEIIFYSAN